jgi:hypothetical protein
VLHPFLLHQLTATESMPQLRCIAAWTLARYVLWTVDQLEMRGGEGGGGASLVGQVAKAFTLRMLDQHKKVQIASCLVMGVFAEVAGDHLTPYLEPIYGYLSRRSINMARGANWCCSIPWESWQKMWGRWWTGDRCRGCTSRRCYSCGTALPSIIIQ